MERADVSTENAKAAPKNEKVSWKIAFVSLKNGNVSTQSLVRVCTNHIPGII